MVKAVFLDRDGVINEDVHLLYRKEQMKLIPSSAQAIRLLNDHYFLVIVVTNQPVVGRGMCSEKEVEEINEIMKQRLMQQANGKIDAIYYCPHHPTAANNPEGFTPSPEYVKECECRKPNPGMILQAQKDFGLDLSKCYIIGDMISDIKAGESAGIKKTILVKSGGVADNWNDAVPKYTEQNLYCAVKNIILKENLKLFINTGGEGKRLYPLTKDIPKPMVPISNKPVLHHLVDWAKKQPIKSIVMMNGYKAEKIMDYFRDGNDSKIPIAHSNEPYPLGSGGPIKFAKNHIDGRFAYISGDLVCDVDLEKMNDFHEKNNADMTVLVHETSHPQDSDILKLNETERVVEFVSKHEDHTGAGNLSNAGLCIIEPAVIELIDKEVFNFENYLYPRILSENMRLYGYKTDEFIRDMGTFERLKICEEFLRSKQKL